MYAMLLLFELLTTPLMPDARWLYVAAYGIGLIVGGVVGAFWMHTWIARK